MEYEISIQAIIIGMLKKWKLMLVTFLVVLAVALGFNIYRAKQAADKINQENQAAASGENVTEKTVTTASKEVLTVSQLNMRIKNLRERVAYFEKLAKSPKMIADAGKFYSYAKKYYISRPNSDGKDNEQLAYTIASALTQYVQSEEIKSKMDNAKDIVDLDYLADVVSITPDGSSVSVQISYLEENATKNLMSIAEPIVIEKFGEYKNAIGDFSYTLIETTGSISADEDLINAKNNNDVALSKSKTDLDALEELALTVEDKSEVGQTEEAKSSSATNKSAVSWQSQLGKKNIALSVIIAIIVACVIGFAWAILLNKKLMSAYDVADISGKEVLGVEGSDKKGLLEQHQIKHFGNEDSQLTIAKIKKTVDAKGGRILIDRLGPRKTEGCSTGIVNQLVASGIDVVDSGDFDNRAQFIEAGTSDDVCLFLVKIGEATRAELINRLIDYQKFEVAVMGSFVDL
ncbi:MAG: hypothetical protein E7241_00200 [Lachnospiraceae bacterium]|nr:hypothetical protein [Lachnospiraceae bacterium]